MDNNAKNALAIGIGATGVFLLGKFIWGIISRGKQLTTTTPSKSICMEIGGTNIRVLVNETPVISIETLKQSVEGSKNIRDYKTKDRPEDTIKEICTWYVNANPEDYKVGVSMFGPICLKKDSINYGKVLNTPKPGWSNFNLLNSLSSNLGLKLDQINIELDVNCAAFLEYKFGGHNVNSLAYITIGTGVGVGLITDRKVNQGLEGPEGGHIRVRRHENDHFEGNCPFHKDCLEGLIANGAIKKRKNLESVDECKFIDSNDEIWDFVAYYLAQLCLSLLLLPSVEKILIGGGIANRSSMIQKTREHFFRLNNGYISNPKLTLEGLNNYIMRTEFENNSGILSAYAII